MFVVIAATSPC